MLVEDKQLHRRKTITKMIITLFILLLFVFMEIALVQG